MIKIKIILVVFIVAGAATSLMVRHQSQVKFKENAALLRGQDEQSAALNAKYQRLSNRVTNANNDAATDNQATELARLRIEAEALKRQSNDLSRQLEAKQTSQPMSAPESHSAEYWERLQQTANIKVQDATYLAWAFGNYVGDHQGQGSPNLDQLAPYLAKNKWTLSGSNQFEIIYQGSIVPDTLDTIPIQTIAVVRDQQTWQGKDGRMMRVYGFAMVGGQIISSDDNFQSWEAQHVILPSKAAQ